MQYMNEGYKKCYEKNKSKYIAKQVERNRLNVAKIKQYLWDYKTEQGCADCTEVDPVVMEFDHIGNKSFTVSNFAAKGKTLEKVKQELEKCEVVCANCHRRRTAKRGNWHKEQLGGVV